MHNRKSTMVLLNDPLSIFNDLEDVRTSYQYLQYHFFANFDLDKIDWKKENAEFSHYMINLMNLSTSNKRGFPIIPMTLFGYIPKCNTWGRDLYNHCLISSLHTVLYMKYKFAPADNCVTPYMANKLLESCPGYFELKYNDFPNAESISDSYWNHQMKTKEKKLYRSFIYGMDINAQYEGEKFKLPRYKIKFLTWLRINQERLWQGLAAMEQSAPSENRFTDLMNKIWKICGIPETESRKGTKVDNILLQYQCERFFNVHILYHLFDKVPDVSKYYDRDLWLSILEMPNVFSRARFVDWMIESWEEGKQHLSLKYNGKHFGEKTDLVQSPSTNKLELFPIVNSSTEKMQKIDSALYGLEYLNKIVFPFYEKYYFCLLFTKMSREMCGIDAEQILYADQDKVMSILDSMEKYLYQECTTLNIPFLDDYSNDHMVYEYKRQYTDIINGLMNEHSNLDLYFRKTYSEQYFGVMLPAPYMGQNVLGSPMSTLNNYYDTILEHEFKLMIMANGGTQFDIKEEKAFNSIDPSEIKSF